ncbi:hypothetical protein D3C85_1664070 [compost metagenome]
MSSAKLVLALVVKYSFPEVLAVLFFIFIFIILLFVILTLRLSAEMIYGSLVVFAPPIYPPDCHPKPLTLAAVKLSIVEVNSHDFPIPIPLPL